MVRMPAVVVGLTFAAGSAASAQAPASDFLDLPRNSPVVHVVSESGRESTGRLFQIRAESFSLLIDGRIMHFDREDVRQIYGRDSIANGAGIGGLVGMAAGVAIGFSQDMSGCDESMTNGARLACKGIGKSLATLIIAPLTALVGFGAGAAIDHLHQGRTLIYQRPAAPRISFAPVVSRDRKGVAFAVSW